MKKYFLLAAPVLVLATPAYGQEATVGGLRIEGIIGYEQINVGIDDEDIAPGQETGDVDGLYYGVGVGYDIPTTGGVTFGVDAEFTESTGDRVLFEGRGNRQAEVDFGRDLYVGGRITFAASDNFGVYLKGGYSNFRVSARASDVGEPFDDDATDLDTNLDGLRGAVGVSFGSNDNVSYGFEVRYSNYENGVDKRQAALRVGIAF